MQPEVIESGLVYFTELAGLSSDEKVDFRDRYLTGWRLDDHLLVWVSLKTVFALSYLDPAGWIIFVEDEAGNQYEPADIILQPVPQQPREEPQEAADIEGYGEAGGTRSLALLFRRKSFNETPILSGESGILKLVFLRATNLKIRAEGVWRIGPA